MKTMKSEIEMIWLRRSSLPKVMKSGKRDIGILKHVNSLHVKLFVIETVVEIIGNILTSFWTKTMDLLRICVISLDIVWQMMKTNGKKVKIDQPKMNLIGIMKVVMETMKMINE